MLFKYLGGRGGKSCKLDWGYSTLFGASVFVKSSALMALALVDIVEKSQPKLEIKDEWWAGTKVTIEKRE